MAITKCQKCGNDLRVNPEQVGVDKDNLPVFHRFGYCDVCKIKYDLDAPNNQMHTPATTAKKDSALSILAAVFALFTCTCVIGLILGIIDLCINDKTKRHLGSWFAIIFSVIVLAVGFHVGTSTPSSNTSETAPSTPVYSPAPITEVKENDDGIIDTEIDGCSLKYLRHEIKQNYSGDDCIVVYYEFTNNSKETTSYMYTFSDQAFQNGIELEKSLFLLDEEEDNRSKDIKPGISIEVYSLFVPQDNSIVELEVSEWISLSDKPIDKMQLLLE